MRNAIALVRLNERNKITELLLRSAGYNNGGVEPARDFARLPMFSIKLPASYRQVVWTGA